MGWRRGKTAIYPAVVTRRRFGSECAPGEHAIHMIRRNTHASYGMASVGANTGEGWLHVHGRRGWGIPTIGSVNQRTQTKENYTSSTIPTNLDWNIRPLDAEYIIKGK